MTLTITGRIPSKKNSKRLVSAGGRPFILPSKEYEAWHELKMWELARFRPTEPITKASLSLTFYPPDHIRADLTNKAESVADLLVDAGILSDDSWFVLEEVTLRLGGVDAKRPRVEIQITTPFE